MGLFSKKKTAEDILEMIAELPEEERALVMDMLNGNPEEKAAEPADAEAEENPEESFEEEGAADGAEEEPTLDNPAEEETEEKSEEAEPEEAETEEAGDPVVEAETAEETPAETVEKEPEEPAPEMNFSEILDRVNRMEETIVALAQRIDAAEAEKKEEDDPFGMSIGAETKSDDQEDELERAKREAGFNF